MSEANLKSVEAMEAAQPLIGVPAYPSASGMKVAPRQWRGKWWAFLGDLSPVDVTAFCLTVNAPFVAFAWNMQRTLALSFWRELIRFVLIVGGVAFGARAACCVMLATLCPQAMPPRPDEDELPYGQGPGPHGPHPGLGPLHDDDDDDGHPPGLPEECVARVVPAFVAIAVVAIALAVCTLLFFARRRTAIRERFGIEGSAKEDTLLHLFCTPCALAQETRTLMHEQVHDGVWYGALPGVHPQVISAAPAPMKMAV